MKILPTALFLAISAPSVAGCAHYVNMDMVDERCWGDGQTAVSSRASRDGTYHVVVERARTSTGPCMESFREDLVYDRRGHLEARRLARIRCGVVEERWVAQLDRMGRSWLVEQSIDANHDDQDDAIIHYEVPASETHLDRLGRVDSCPLMTRLPVDASAGRALVVLEG